MFAIRLSEILHQDVRWSKLAATESRENLAALDVKFVRSLARILLEGDYHLHSSLILWDWACSEETDEADSSHCPPTPWVQGSWAEIGSKGLMYRAIRAARLVLAVSIRCCSYATSPLLIALRHADRSWESVSPELCSTPESFMEALSVPLKHFF